MEPLPDRCLAVASTLLLAGFLSAQVNDGFTDGDFASAPAWSGTNGLFTVVDDGGNQRLRSNSATAANYYLSTPSTIANDARWEFFVDLRFSTSGANYVDFFLMSDGADLSGAVNGYFLRMGGTPDRLELFRSDAGSGTSTGLQSPDGVVNGSSSNPFLLRVERTAAADWTLWFDDGATGTYTLAGTINDATYTSPTHFGLRIEQSSAGTVVNNHFFDDFAVGPIPVDLTPPTLVSATAVSATEADLLFNEAVDPVTAAESMHYTLDCGSTVTAATVQNATTVRITFAPALASGTSCMATVNGVLDLAGNASANTTASFLYFVADAPEPGDVVINEIMADPDPTVGLPAVEFIEIHNTTADKTFDLADWTLTDGNGTGTLPAATLQPGGFAILCDDGNATLFTTFGLAVGFATFPSSLTNTGELLDLKDPSGVTIDAVTYSDAWYNDDIKAGGGWTLERVDPTTPCSSAANWTASNDALGGTPGEQNSVFAITPDVTAPTLVSVFVNSAAQIELLFSEAMNTVSLAGGNYQFDPALSVDLSIPTSDHQVQLTLATALVVGQLYTVTVTGVTDCVGNTIGAGNTLTFALPEPVLPGDVVINEVLYDPAGSGSDFVELYNRSGKVLSIAGWKLANEIDGVIGNATVITSSAFILMPGEYVLITEDEDNIAERYPLSRTDRFVQADMPSYNNGEGVVVLQDAAGDTLDRFAYNDELHFALLNSSDGVSLERVSPARPTDDATNWHSAAENVGYATPGYQNSQYSPSSTISGELTIERRIFSPDNDGFEDVLNITYLFQAPGFTGTLKVFDVAGREVKTLIDNQLLGTVGTISWDGIREEGDLARMGPYIVMLEAFDVDGHVERFRETVVLAHKMN